jgi:hypothetical protein
MGAEHAWVQQQDTSGDHDARYLGRLAYQGNESEGLRQSPIFSRERVRDLPLGVDYIAKPWEPLNVLIAAEQALAFGPIR